MIDTVKESLAIAEANKLGIPVVAVLDSNSDPNGIAYPIPGNDDAIRAIKLYCELISGAVLDGISAEMAAAGVDIGEQEEAPLEPALAGEEVEGQAAADEAAPQAEEGDLGAGQNAG